MATIQSWTTNSEINFENHKLASFSSRFGAFIIDALIGLPIGLFVVLPMLDSSHTERTYGFVMLAPVFLIKTVSQISSGRSFGQKVTGINVAGNQSNKTSVGILRNLIAFVIMAIPVANTINALVIIFNKNNQGIHDMVARTYVISSKSKL